MISVPTATFLSSIIVLICHIFVRYYVYEKVLFRMHFHFQVGIAVSTAKKALSFRALAVRILYAKSVFLLGSLRWLEVVKACAVSAWR